MAQENFISQWWQRRQDRKRTERLRYEKMTTQEKMIDFVKTLLKAFVLVVILNGILLAAFTVPTGSMEDTVLTGENLFVNKFIFGPSTPQIIPLFNIALPYFKTPPIRKPRQGDVIVFIFPGNREQVKADEFTYYLKRCIAVSGDTISIVNDSVYVNGVQFPLPPQAKYDPAAAMPDAYIEADKASTFPPGKGFARSNYGPLRVPAEGDVIQLNETNFEEWRVFIQREGHKAEWNNGGISIDGQKATSYTVERNYVFGMGDNRWNSLDSRYWGFIPEHDVVGTPLIVYWSWADKDRNGRELSLFGRLAHIRWSRLGTIIR
ncbi:MAG: signal peptidase I [Candidatus Kapabacteria bacterium]|nr:signal peptidase I [Candidatus Kapabacteria bacterium]